MSRCQLKHRRQMKQGLLGQGSGTKRATRERGGSAQRTYIFQPWRCSAFGSWQLQPALRWGKLRPTWALIMPTLRQSAPSVLRGSTSRQLALTLVSCAQRDLTATARVSSALRDTAVQESTLQRGLPCAPTALKDNLSPWMVPSTARTVLGGNMVAARVKFLQRRAR